MSRARKLLLEAGLDTHVITATVPNAGGSTSLQGSPGFEYGSGEKKKAKDKMDKQSVRRVLALTKEIRSE